jgi:MFS superfamily sulfate permease-like transporter
LLGELGRLSFHFRLPAFTLTKLSQSELISGIFVLGLPQVALTLGNAIIATVEENNAVFPTRPITVKAVAIDHGIMNVVGSSLGGVPMCHGAGGMAAHIRFGARTGGALVILGSMMLVLGLFFADSIATFFKLFPSALLGVILMFGGLELAAGVQPNHAPKEDRYVMFLTAGIATWNMGVGYLVGLLLWYAFQWRWLKA